MRITVDSEKCVGIGICESISPERFEIDDDGDMILLEASVEPDDVAEAERAVAGCPSAALRLTP